MSDNYASSAQAAAAAYVAAGGSAEIPAVFIHIFRQAVFAELSKPAPTAVTNLETGHAVKLD